MPAAPEPSLAHADAGGTQAIRRAAAMLKRVAVAGSEGAVLADLSRLEGLARSTAHRILRALTDEGFVEQDPNDKRYRVGALLHELCLTPGPSAREIAQWRPAVETVARSTGVTAYLMRRSGIEAVCLLKADGHSALRFVPVEVGQRRLLGVGAGATALLAALPEQQIEEVLRHIAAGYSAWPRITEAGVRDAVAYVQRTGFAMSQGTVVEGGFGLGAVIPDAGRTPHLAISIAAHASTVTDSVVEQWRETIARAVAAGSA